MFAHLFLRPLSVLGSLAGMAHKVCAGGWTGNHVRLTFTCTIRSTPLHNFHNFKLKENGDFYGYWQFLPMPTCPLGVSRRNSQFNATHTRRPSAESRTPGTPNRWPRQVWKRFWTYRLGKWCAGGKSSWEDVECGGVEYLWPPGLIVQQWLQLFTAVYSRMYCTVYY